MLHRLMGAGLYGWSVVTKQVRRLWRVLRPPTIVWITPELALGPSFHKRQVRTLARAGIGSVIDLRSEASDDEDLLARRGLHLYRVPVGDGGAPTEAQLDEVTRWALREIAAGRKVYVHCQSGIGRSPAVAAAILVAMGHSLSDAYNAVRRRRPWASLSSVQCEALEQFERSVRERRSLDE
jgi:protein-tyrosine phosphatase